MERRRIFREEARQKGGLTQERRKQKWREVDGILAEESRGLDRGLEVERVPRILACTLLSTAFTTNYLNCIFIEVRDPVLCLPHLDAQKILGE